MLIFDCQLDSHFVNLLETKIKDSKFARVDSESVDKLIEKDKKDKPQLPDGLERDMIIAFESILPKGYHYMVEVDNLGITAPPILITQSEFMRRYREMSAMNGGMNFYGSMPESYSVTLNYENPIIKKIIEDKEAKTSKELAPIDDQIRVKDADLKAVEEKVKGKKEDEIDTVDKDNKEALGKDIANLNEERKSVIDKFAKDNILMQQITDLALLSNNMLKGKDLHEFIHRSLDILK